MAQREPFRSGPELRFAILLFPIYRGIHPGVVQSLRRYECRSITDALASFLRGPDC